MKLLLKLRLFPDAYNKCFSFGQPCHSNLFLYTEGYKKVGTVSKGRRCDAGLMTYDHPMSITIYS
jgi:hypothetical protein